MPEIPKLCGSESTINRFFEDKMEYTKHEKSFCFGPEQGEKQQEVEESYGRLCS